MIDFSKFEKHYPAGTETRSPTMRILRLVLFVLKENEPSRTIPSYCVDTINPTDLFSAQENEIFVSHEVTLCEEATTLDIAMNSRTRWHTDENSVHIFTKANTRTIAKNILQYLPAVIPWSFKEKPLTDWEKELISELLKEGDSSSKAETMLNEWYDKQEFGTKAIRLAIEEFASGGIQEKIDAEMRRRDVVMDDIQRIQESLNRALDSYYSTEKEIARLEREDTQDLSELIQFVSRNKAITLLTGNLNCITFKVTADLGRMNSRSIPNMLRNTNHALYDGAPNRYQAQFLYEKIWKTREIKLLANSYFEMNVSKTVDFYRGRKEFLNALPNPHVEHFKCKGSFASSFADAALNGDYIDVMSIAIAYGSNINFDDSMPMRRLSADLWKENCRCLEYNGKYYTATEILATVFADEVPPLF